MAGGLAHAVALALAGLGAALTAACALGVLVMRDPWQRLQFLAPPASLGVLLVAGGAALDAGQAAAAVKAALIVALVMSGNAVVTHATARAHFARSRGGWPPRDRVPLAGPEARGRSEGGGA